MAAARSLDVLVGAGPTRRKAWAPALAIGTHTLTLTAMSRGEVHGSTPTPARTALAATTLITTATASRSVVGYSICWFVRAVCCAGSSGGSSRTNRT